jgi:hypothetical protein
MSFFLVEYSQTIHAMAPPDPETFEDEVVDQGLITRKRPVKTRKAPTSKTQKNGATGRKNEKNPKSKKPKTQDADPDRLIIQEARFAVPNEDQIDNLISDNGIHGAIDLCVPDGENPGVAYANQLTAFQLQRMELVQKINPSESHLHSQSAVLSGSQATEDLLRMLAQSPRDTLRTTLSNGGIVGRAAITIVTRAWEEKFMHEASGAERACVNSRSRTCFAGLIASNGIVDPGFSLVEFYTEDDYNLIRLNGWKWPTQKHACILCRRNEAFARLLSCRCNGMSAPAGVCYSSIGNLVEKPREYCVEDVFASKPGRYEGILVPIVIPCISDYLVSSIGGVRQLQQLLPYPDSRRSSFFF